MEAYASRPVTGDASRAKDPFDEAVARLATLVERVVGHPVDPSVNFFEAGLDSLAIVTLHDLVCAEFGTELAPTTLFLHPNVVALAQVIGGGVEPGPSAGAGRARGRRNRSVERRRDLRRGARRTQR